MIDMVIHMVSTMNFHFLIQICQHVDSADPQIDHLEKNRLIYRSMIQHSIAQTAVPTLLAVKCHLIDQEWTHQMEIIISYKSHHPKDMSITQLSPGMSHQFHHRIE